MTILTTSQKSLKEFLIKEEEKFWAEHSNNKPEDYFFDADEAIQNEIKSGINSIEEYNHSQAVTEHFYAHAEIYGWKPRGKDYTKMTTEAIIAETEAMYAQRDENEIEKSLTDSQKIAMVNDNNNIPNNPFAHLKELMESC